MRQQADSDCGPGATQAFGLTAGEPNASAQAGCGVPKPDTYSHIFGAIWRHLAAGFFSARSFGKFCRIFCDLQQLATFRSRSARKCSRAYCSLSPPASANFCFSAAFFLTNSYISRAGETSDDRTAAHLFGELSGNNQYSIAKKYWRFLVEILSLKNSAKEWIV